MQTFKLCFLPSWIYFYTDHNWDSVSITNEFLAKMLKGTKLSIKKIKKDKLTFKSLMLSVLIPNLCKIHFILLVIFSFYKENTFFSHWLNCDEKIRNLMSVDYSHFCFFFFSEGLEKNWLQLMLRPLYLSKNITWLTKRELWIKM